MTKWSDMPLVLGTPSKWLTGTQYVCRSVPRHIAFHLFLKALIGFKEVEESYWFGPVCLSSRLSVHPSVCYACTRSRTVRDRILRTHIFFLSIGFFIAELYPFSGLWNLTKKRLKCLPVEP